MSGGLRIIWDPAIDGGAWPGALGGRTAIAGELWLGPLGLLARLETELGLGAIHATTLERAGELVAALAGRDGWWRASYDADALGTCQRLLRDRDLLALWGWRGEPASARLAALWAATAGARPGLPDRLAAVTAALASGRPDLESIELYAPISSLAPAWHAVFAQLAHAGVRLLEATLPAATARGDLAAARAAGFAPTGDGRLTLLRPHGPIAAAEEIAASLAALPSTEGVLVIGADDVLDAALARHGVPRVGASTRPTASSALLRLVIEAAFEPMDPTDLHALLCLSPGPVPRRVAAGLIGALSTFPGRRTASWDEALAAGLAHVEDDRRESVAARIAALVMPAAARLGMIATTEIDRRLAILATWARSRLSSEASLVAIAVLAEDARTLLTRYGAPELSLVQLRRLCDDLDRSRGLPAAADAGLAAVADPGAVLAPAPVIVWWNFTRDSAPHLPRLRLSNAERAELVRLGVSPPDPGLLMEGEARRWRRPLELATDTLVLVCPRTSEAGDDSSPHPLWDELCAAMPQPDQAGVLVATALALPAPAARRTPAVRPLPAPVPGVAIDAGVALPLRERESPSSLDKLIGCSLAWALTYHGKLRGGLADGPGAPSPLLYGNLAHHILEQVFGPGVLDAEAALARAHEILDRDLATLAENLALPRYQVERTAVRQAILASARELGALMTELGATVRGVEVTEAGEHGGFALTGKADLVLDGPGVVIDLKWGGKSHETKLRAGAALQLAIYAELFGTGATAPEVAYFALQNQQLIAPGASTLPRAKRVGATTPRETWTGALATLGVRRAELAAGTLHAPGADGADHDSALVAGQLSLAPSCEYCAFGTLCGESGCT